MDFRFQRTRSSPSFMMWLILLALIAILSVCFYEIFAPVSDVSKESDGTPYDRRVFRQLRGLGGIVLLTVLYNMYIYSRTARYL